MDLLDRLATKFTVGDGCWEWTGAIQSNGYGTLSLDSRTQLAHRVVYEALVGPIPEGLNIDHLCRNHRCVRPTHLEPVTHSENALRGIDVGKGQAKKTHCPQGHPYDGANTYVYPKTGYRFCRKCRLAAKRRFRVRRREG